MGRATRSYKLRLSPAGMDLLIDSHCHLIRTTRRLLAWGTTLHVAVAYLERLPASVLAAELALVQTEELSGPEEHHVGAHNQLAGLATTAAERIAPLLPSATAPSLGSIYLLALVCLVKADRAVLADTYDQTRL